MKILCAQRYTRADFDEVLRIPGTQTRIARKGTEWFLLDATLRVVGITTTKERVRSMARERRVSGNAGWLALHNIEDANRGRCSTTTSQALFRALKGKS